MASLLLMLLIELQYLAPIQYYAKLCSGQPMLIEQHEHYIKRSYRNRAHILGANGMMRLTIPLKKGKNEGQAIREVQIEYVRKWQQQHWQSIRSAYGKSPFFEHYSEELRPFFEKKYKFLFDFNFELMENLMDLIGINPEISLTNNYTHKPCEDILDLRNSIHPKEKHHKPDSHYQSITYAQVFQDKFGFVPDLSVLDLLFCMGSETSLILEQSNV